MSIPMSNLPEREVGVDRAGRPSRWAYGLALVAAGSTFAFAAPRADAHDISGGWTLTGGADSACIKSRGTLTQEHARASFSVRFEHTVPLGIEKVCTTATVTKRYRLAGRGIKDGKVCWYTDVHTGNAPQASISVNPVRAVCGVGTYKFETHGKLQASNGSTHGTPFTWGSHHISRK